MFAERVLGYTTHHFSLIHGGTADDGWALTGKPKGGDILLPYPRPLPHYTRSLDAVLNATNYSGGLAVKFCCRDIHCDHDYIYKASVAFDNEGHCTFNGRSCDHPAEALVLACLRAVGCSEEELQ